MRFDLALVLCNSRQDVDGQLIGVRVVLAHDLDLAKLLSTERMDTIERCSSAMNDIRTRELYASPNGDRWHLCKDASGTVFVVHQPNIPSGGNISRIELGDFLSRGRGPEQQHLLKLIGSILDSPPGELLTGEQESCTRFRH